MTGAGLRARGACVGAQPQGVRSFPPTRAAASLPLPAAEGALAAARLQTTLAPIPFGNHGQLVADQHPRPNLATEDFTSCGGATSGGSFPVDGLTTGTVPGLEDAMGIRRTSFQCLAAPLALAPLVTDRLLMKAPDRALATAPLIPPTTSPDLHP
jgi:hypothetical protein